MQFYIFVMLLGLPDDIHEEKSSFLQFKKNALRTDGQTDGRTDPRIEMRRRIEIGAKQKSITGRLCVTRRLEALKKTEFTTDQHIGMQQFKQLTVNYFLNHDIYFTNNLIT